MKVREDTMPCQANVKLTFLAIDVREVGTNDISNISKWPMTRNIIAVKADSQVIGKRLCVLN